MSSGHGAAFPEAPRPVPTGAPWLDAWRRDLEAHGSPPLAQAATVDSGGVPEVRTVVVRGVSRDGCPVFTTDLRSAKARAVRTGSAVALCVWWADRGVQVRLRGPATLVAGGDGAWSDVRARLWLGHRETERRGFAGPPPGSPWKPGEPAPAASPDETPHANFGLVVVTPHRVDRLVLGDPHVRTTYRWHEDLGWRGGRVAP